MLLLLFALAIASSQGLKLAFVGDTGAQKEGENGYFAVANFDMMHRQGVDLVVHNGDLDYDSDPEEWDRFAADYAKGRGMEVLVSSGNHEENIWFGFPWYGSNGYKARLEAQVPDSPMLADNCFGEYGEEYYCEIGDVLIVVLGWDEIDDRFDINDSVEFLENVFRNTNSKVKFCSWHRPEGKLNPSDTHIRNYRSQRLYEVCRQNGAMIASGHSHVYGRTKMISSFLPGNTDPGDNPDPQVSSVDSANPTLTCGVTFSSVVGMGGFKFNGDGRYASREYFAKKFTADDSPVDRAGALLCDVPDEINGDVAIPCEFRLSTDEIIDEFVITIKEESFGNNCMQAYDASAEDCAVFGIFC